MRGGLTLLNQPNCPKPVFTRPDSLALLLNQLTVQEWEGSPYWGTPDAWVRSPDVWVRSPDVWVRAGSPDVHLPWHRDGGQAGGGQVSREIRQLASSWPHNVKVFTPTEFCNPTFYPKLCKLHPQIKKFVKFFGFVDIFGHFLDLVFPWIFFGFIDVLD